MHAAVAAGFIGTGRRRAVALLVAVILASGPLAASAPRGAHATPAPPASDAVDDREDPVQRRAQQLLGGLDLGPAPGAAPTPGVTQDGDCDAPGRSVRDTALFWVHDFSSDRSVRQEFTLAAIGEHSYQWVESVAFAPGAPLDRYDQRISPEEARRAARAFDSVYRTNRAYFGSPAQCHRAAYATPRRLRRIWGSTWFDADDESHLHVLNFVVGAHAAPAGYYSAADEFPSSVNQYSNEGEFVYANIHAIPTGTRAHAGLLAHELFHAILFANDADEESWLNEGLAELAKLVNGYGSFAPGAYAREGDEQLTQFDGSGADYGSGLTFAVYFLEHYGPRDDPDTRFNERFALARRLVRARGNGLSGIDQVLAENPHRGSLRRYYRDRSARHVFLDRAVADVINDASLRAGQYGYFTFPRLRLRSVHEWGAPTGSHGRLRTFGTRIHSFRQTEPVEVVLRAARRIAVVPNLRGMPSPRHELWLNRGDDLDTYVVRAADLRGAVAPVLRFGYWYDIETDWDYAYLEVSTNGGTTWRRIRCRCGSRTSDPHGTNDGFGVTGRSGGWQTALRDLSRFAGQRVLLRFRYSTDGAFTRPGFALDDIRLTDGDRPIWGRQTFDNGAGAFDLRGPAGQRPRVIDPMVRNDALLQLVALRDGAIHVERVAAQQVDDRRVARAVATGARVVAIFTSLTPGTTESFGFDWNASW